VDRVISSTYDLSADALYLQVTDAAVARTEGLDSGTLVDLDEAGNVVGLEVIHPDRVWPLGELLRRYNLAAEDRAQLEVLFPSLNGVHTEGPPYPQNRAQQFTGVGIKIPA
jgi:uncharacterized protein YuzE